MGLRAGLKAVEKEKSFASAPSPSLVAMTTELPLLLSGGYRVQAAEG